MKASTNGTKVVAAAALAVLIAPAACTQLAHKDLALEQAQTVGKYHVKISTDMEKVTGTCTYVISIQPDMDPVRIPTDPELDDYYRTWAVYNGADTVLVKFREGRIGEAYICGPGPLNPDGTLKGYPATVTPPAH